MLIIFVPLNVVFCLIKVRRTESAAKLCPSFNMGPWSVSLVINTRSPFYIDMLGSRVSIHLVYRVLLCSLCVMLIAPLINTDANASEREFGVGFSWSSTPDPMGGQMQYALWYPTNVPNGTLKFDQCEFPGTENAEPAAGQFGLVILSHGSGGGPLGHRDTAVALVKAGFIATAPRHSRNNSRDDIGSHKRIVLDGRPHQFSAVIDALLAS